MAREKQAAEKPRKTPETAGAKIASELPEPMTKSYGEELIKYAHEVKEGKTVTDEKLLEELKTQFFETCEAHDVAQAKAEAFWERFGAELAKRPHLAKFTKDADGCKSMIFPEWVMDIIGQKMSRAMYPAHFRGYDISGNLVEIAPSDPFYVWSAGDPVFIYVRKRDDMANRAMTKPGVKRILIPGAGNLPEIFEIPYDPEKLRAQEIKCCDIAETGVRERVAEMDLPNFEYDLMDMTEFIGKAARFQPDLLMMKGTLSYRMDAVPKIIAAAEQILAPGGVLFFDLQLAHIALVRNLETFTWGEGTFGLLPDADAAVALVRKIVSEAGLKFEIEYEDIRDEDGESVGVVFQLTKAR